jgi:NADPH:quinone reductase-like Zn-dependent oxidoreductase
MKAAMRTTYGPPEVIDVREVEKPAPGDHDVLIRVHAATVNRTDCGILRARPFVVRFFSGMLRPRQRILGVEFAGQVEALGKNVSLFKVGDRVFGFHENGLGAQAEYLGVAEDDALAAMPEKATYEQAAASTEGAHYAYHCIRKANVQRGQDVLVNGASGAIGSAAVQLLKYFGATVTAVCDTKNVDLMGSLGADRVIDRIQEDFTRQEQKYDFVFDAVGKSSFFKCRPLLRPGGVYISTDLGRMGQNVFLPFITPLIKPLIGNKRTMSPIPADAKESVRLVKKLMETGHFKSVIDRSYPLAKIVEAYRYVETGLKTGNVVITMEAQP